MSDLSNGIRINAIGYIVSRERGGLESGNLRAVTFTIRRESHRNGTETEPPDFCPCPSTMSFSLINRYIPPREADISREKKKAEYGNVYSSVHNREKDEEKLSSKFLIRFFSVRSGGLE